MKRSPEDSNGIVLGVGVLIVSIIWSWMFSLHITDLTGSLFTGYLCTMVGFLVITFITVGLFGYIIRRFYREYSSSKQISPMFLVKLFFAWAVAEWLISWLIAVIWIGKNGSFDTVLPFGSFTPFLAYTPFGLLGRFLGFYGVSAAFIVLLSSVCFPRLRRHFPYVVSILVIAIGLSWLLYRVPNGTQTSVLIQAHVKDELPQKINTSSELVLYSEYGLGIDSSLVDLESSEGKEVFYAGSRKSQTENGTENTLVFGSTKQKDMATYAKSRLIPAGEYLPYAIGGILGTIRDYDTLQTFNRTRAIHKGTEPIKPFAIRPGLTLGSGVCASIISPEDYRKLSRQGATLLTNSAELSIFDSPIFTAEHEGLARFMATANARPFAQSSTDGNAVVINHNGSVIRKTPPSNIQEVSATTNTKTTPYSILGEWVVYIGLLAIATGSIKRFIKKK